MPEAQVMAGAAMLVTVLEESLQSMLREKLELQTELELLKLGLHSAPRHHVQSGTSLDTQPDSMLALTHINNIEGAHAPVGSLLELQELVRDLQLENAAVKASLGELLQADDQEFARLHALLAGSPTAEAPAAAAGCASDQPGQSPSPPAGSHDRNMAADQHPRHSNSSGSSMLAILQKQRLMLAQLQHACQTHQNENLQGNRRQHGQQHQQGGDVAALCKLAQQQAQTLSNTLTDLRHAVASTPVIRDAAAAAAVGNHLDAVQQTQVQEQTGQQQQHQQPQQIQPQQAPGNLQQQQPQEPPQQQSQQQPQNQQGQQQQQGPQQTADAEGPASRPRRRTPIPKPTWDTAAARPTVPVAAAALEGGSKQASDSATAHVTSANKNPSAGGGITATAAGPAATAATNCIAHQATAEAPEPKQQQPQQQQQQLHLPDSDEFSDELAALLHEAEQELLPAVARFDSAGNLIAPATAKTAAAAIALVRTRASTSSSQQSGVQQQQQQLCCAFCGEQFPSAAAYWAHCVMPHHVLLLLVRWQQLRSVGLLGLQGADSWWRRPLTLLPEHFDEVAYALAAGHGTADGGGSTKQTTGVVDDGERNKQQLAASSGVECCQQVFKDERRLVEHYLSSYHLDKVAAAITGSTARSSGTTTTTAAAAAAGGLFTPDCCEYIRQLVSSLTAMLRAASTVATMLQDAPQPSNMQKNAHTVTAKKRRQLQQQQLQQLVGVCPQIQQLLDVFASAAEAYVDGYQQLQRAGLTPVPVPQGAEQAVSELLQQYRHQLTTYLARYVTKRQVPAALAAPGPAVQVWMNPGVYVLPVELLMMLEHEPAAAAAASVMLGVPHLTHSTSPQQQQQQQVQQQQQQQEAGKKKGKGQKRKQPLAAAAAPTDIHKPAASKQQQTVVAAPEVVPAAQNTAPVADKASSQQQQEPQPANEPAQTSGAAQEATAAAAVASTAAAAVDKEPEEARPSKRKKHEPIPRPPPAAAAVNAAANNTSGAESNGNAGSGSGRRSGSGGGFVQLGNRIRGPSPPLEAGRSQPGSPQFQRAGSGQLPPDQSDQHHHDRHLGSRPPPGYMSSRSLDPERFVPPPFPSGPPGPFPGMMRPLLPGPMMRPPPRPLYPAGDLGPPLGVPYHPRGQLQQYDDLYEEQAHDVGHPMGPPFPGRSGGPEYAVDDRGYLAGSLAVHRGRGRGARGGFDHGGRGRGHGPGVQGHGPGVQQHGGRGCRMQ